MQNIMEPYFLAQQRDSCEKKDDNLIQNLMRVENRFLNPENEMKRIFGSR